MKLAVLILIAAAAIADETDPEDLGVVTPNRGFHLSFESPRDDLSHFELECLPSTPPTNIIKFILTNVVVTLIDLAPLPSGKILMGVKSVSVDGTASPMKLYRFRIIRSSIPAPKVKGVKILADDAKPGEGLGQAIQSLIQRRPEPPPAPVPLGLLLTNRALKIPPLPGGTNTSYAEALDRIANSHMRRNQ